jgi:ubiquinol-cytochrome c reductase cytochrome b subunit
LAAWRRWISDRFGLQEIQAAALDRRVARTPWYYGDGATLTLLFGILIATGAMMTLTYTPSPAEAYESVVHITERQRLGWFIRALHYWSAGLMVVMLFWHLFRQILIAGYKPPREGTWLIGVLLFVGIIIMAFTGYVLRWDERAIYALRVSLHMFHNVPLIGEHLVVFVQGDAEPGALTLTRIYAVHIIFVPLLLMALVGFHLYLVILHGVTSPAERDTPVESAEQQKALYKREANSPERGETFYPETMARSSVFAFIVFALVVILALLLGPQELAPPANLTERAFPAEEWWYWWVSGLIAYLPPRIAPAFVVVFPIVLFVFLMLLPFIDRSPYRGMRKRPVAVAAVIVCIAAVLYLSDMRRVSPWTAWPDEQPPPVPEGFQLPLRAEQGRILFARYGCNTCHPIAGHGPLVAPDLARIRFPFSRAEMRGYILRPPPGVAMPAYEGRISEADLERIVDFIHTAQAFPRR